MESQKNDLVSNRIEVLAQSIKDMLYKSAQSIAAVNSNLQLLALNAKIQAAKVGSVGAGFSVVASEIRSLSARTQAITSEMEKDAEVKISELMHLNTILETQVRGKRLSQVARNCIDIIDRNLYERSCDVRWWATESAVVEATLNPTSINISRASERLAKILESYTVYYDIVLCNQQGEVICNGRPAKYHCIGAQAASYKWFKQAMDSKDGSEYGFEGPFTGSLAGNQEVLVYSCGVRANDSQGRSIGVLGVVFNWVGLSQEVLKSAEEVLRSETVHSLSAYICSNAGEVYSATTKFEKNHHVVSDVKKLLSQQDLFLIEQQGSNRRKLIGAAPSLGYETYKTGWVSIIIESQ